MYPVFLSKLPTLKVKCDILKLCALYIYGLFNFCGLSNPGSNPDLSSFCKKVGKKGQEKIAEALKKKMTRLEHGGNRKWNWETYSYIMYCVKVD